MKRITISKLFFLLCLFAGSLTLLSIDSRISNAQALPTTQATILQVLNVRSGPSTRFPVIARLAIGMSVQVTGRTPDGQELWWQIHFPPESGQIGWIFGDPSLVRVANPDQPPIVTNLPLPQEESPIRPNSGPQINALFQVRSSDVRDVTFAPTGLVFATAHGNSDNFAVRVWRTSDGSPLYQIREFAGIVWSVAFSPDGQWLAAVADDPGNQSLYIRRSADGKRVQLPPDELLTAAFYSLAFSPDSSKLAVGGLLKGGAIRGITGVVQAGVVRIYDTKTWRLLQSLDTSGQNTLSVAFSPDGRLLVTGGVADGIVRVWQVSDWRMLSSFQAGRLGIRQLAVSPDSNLLASSYCDESGSYGCIKGGVLVTSLNNGATLQRFTDIAESVAFSPDGKFLATGSSANDPAIRLRNTSDWLLVQSLPGLANRVAFSSDGKYLAANDIDQARLWSLRLGGNQATTPANNTPGENPLTAGDPKVLSFTVVPTITQNLGDPFYLTWQAEGERAELCQLEKTQLNCQPVPLSGTQRIISDRSMLGISGFVMQVTKAGRTRNRYINVSLQCQNLHTWFFANPPLTCPLEPAALSHAAFQRFERGMMVWVDGAPGQGDDLFYVFLKDSGTFSHYATLRAPFTLRAGASPENRSGDAPPPGYFEPISGFGMLWRGEFETENNPDLANLRGRLGWALAAEEGYEFAKQCASHLNCYLRLPGDKVLLTFPGSTVGTSQLWTVVKE